MNNKKRLIETVTDSSPKGHTYTLRFWGGAVAEVALIDYPSKARATLARTTRGYTGNYTFDSIPEEEIAPRLFDLKNTKLGTPAEMLNFVFLVRDVPRSWTHQAVRTRIGAAVVQESTRFIGARRIYNLYVPPSMHKDGKVVTAYLDGHVAAIQAFETLVERKGTVTQDARNMLPHSVLTHMFWSITLRALMGVYNTRWCCQAEPGTWMSVMKQMKMLINHKCGGEISGFLTSPFTRGEDCGFHASFDRPCTWKK